MNRKAFGNIELESLKKKLYQPFSRFEAVRSAYLFGSRITGVASQKSDLDVAIRLISDISPEDAYGIRLALMGDIEALFDCPIDIVILNSASLKLIHQVFRYGKLIYVQLSEEEHEYRIRKQKEYFDFQYYINKERSDLRDFYNAQRERFHMLDRETIESKLRFLKEYLVDLKEYESILLNDYRQSKKDQRFVERTLHLACESCLDVAAHLVSRLGFREARDNKDLFAILHENSVISETTSQAMVKMSKFRNIVVHDYARIDPEIVIGLLKKDLNDFNVFAREILHFLDTDTTE